MLIGVATGTPWLYLLPYTPAHHYAIQRPVYILTVTVPRSGTAERAAALSATSFVNFTNLNNVHQMWLIFHWLPIHPFSDILMIIGTNGCKLVWTTWGKKRLSLQLYSYWQRADSTRYNYVKSCMEQRRTQYKCNGHDTAWQSWTTKHCFV